MSPWTQTCGGRSWWSGRPCRGVAFAGRGRPCQASSFIGRRKRPCLGTSVWPCRGRCRWFSRSRALGAAVNAEERGCAVGGRGGWSAVLRVAAVGQGRSQRAIVCVAHEGAGAPGRGRRARGGSFFHSNINNATHTQCL